MNKLLVLVFTLPVFSFIVLLQIGWRGEVDFGKHRVFIQKGSVVFVSNYRLYSVFSADASFEKTAISLRKLSPLRYTQKCLIPPVWYSKACFIFSSGGVCYIPLWFIFCLIVGFLSLLYKKKGVLMGSFCLFLVLLVVSTLFFLQPVSYMFVQKRLSNGGEDNYSEGVLLTNLGNVDEVSEEIVFDDKVTDSRSFRLARNLTFFELMDYRRLFVNSKDTVEVLVLDQ